MKKTLRLIILTTVFIYSTANGQVMEDSDLTTPYDYTVPLVALLSNPEEYSSINITIYGYVFTGLSEVRVFTDKGSCEDHLTANSLYVRLANEVSDHRSSTSRNCDIGKIFGTFTHKPAGKNENYAFGRIIEAEIF